MRHARRALVVLAVTVLVSTVGASVASADPGRGETLVVLRTRDTHPAKFATTRSNNIYSHGGPVQTSTQVYISYWGPEWTGSGFSTDGYTSAQAQTYVGAFFGNVGGSSWINTDTQYCQNVPRGTYFCSTVTGAVYVGNPANQLKRTWNDTTAIPSSPTQSDIAAAALRLMSNFGYSNQATYLVFTPHGKSMNGFATSWCAWHSWTSSSSGQVAYGYIPYQPDAGFSCGMNFINPNDSFGHGYFDGFSVVAGHEYEEAQTDPFPSSGWLDRQGAENADKCAWNSLSGNITIGGQYFAVQPLWSNNTGGCVMSGP